MEIGILVFDGKRVAEDALKEVFDAQADRRPWLHEVGVISRPVVGRLTIHASFPENKEAVYREGDLSQRAGDISAYTAFMLGAVVGPFRQALMSAAAGDDAQSRVAEKEKKLFHIDELKQILPRASSALVLMAEPAIIDEMVQTFGIYDPLKTVRRDVGQELQRRLRALRDQTLEQLAEQLREEQPPAMH
jgi:hypothetical protein